MEIPLVPPPGGVTVRMYRTGLGDCFLLAFSRAAAGPDPGVFYMLIDCGVFLNTPEPDKETRIKRIVANIRHATKDPKRKGGNGRLDLLVITHEHWDHVSAFHETQAQAIFHDEIDLARLWLPWTENLHIKLARDLRSGLKAARHALAHVLARAQEAAARDGDPSAGDKSAAGGLIRRALRFFGADVTDAASAHALAADLGAKKSLKTEEAMRWIKETYGEGKTEFRHPGEPPLALPGVADARVYILGPPEDATLIKRTDPTRGTDEVYPKAMAAVESAFFAAFGVVPDGQDGVPTGSDVDRAKRMSMPFDEEFQIDAKRFRKANPDDDGPTDAFFRDHYFTAEPWRRIETDWLDAAGLFALQLDNATNNTSLAFAVELGPPGEGKVLLFPGDAQVGNWLSWFGKVAVRNREYGKEMSWTVAGKTVTAEDLLRRTVLYKVGHHGSHNATLRSKGLERMGRPQGSSELVAMLPVDEYVAQKIAGYGQMPLGSLVADLLRRTEGRLLRSDEDKSPPEKVPFPTLAGVPMAPEMLARFKGKTKTDLYFDYVIPADG